MNLSGDECFYSTNVFGNLLPGRHQPDTNIYTTSTKYRYSYDCQFLT